MAYLAKDNDGQEVLFASCPRFNEEEGAWIADDGKVVEVSRAVEMLNLEYNVIPTKEIAEVLYEKMDSIGAYLDANIMDGVKGRLITKVWHFSEMKKPKED